MTSLSKIGRIEVSMTSRVTTGARVSKRELVENHDQTPAIALTEIAKHVVIL